MRFYLCGKILQSGAPSIDARLICSGISTLKMAAKRALYKPATLEDVVGCHEKRQGLAQGHLVSSPVLPETMMVFALPRDFNPDVTHKDIGDLTVTFPNSGSPLKGTLTPPRQSLAKRGSTDTRLEDNKIHHSPREVRVGRSVSAPLAPPIGMSPSKPTPSPFLELSDDTDTDPTNNMSQVHVHLPIPHVRHHHPSPVLYVDASGARLDPERSEVETNTDIVLSPVKVICHAPSVVESNLRDTGYTQETAQIKVHSVPVYPVPNISLLGDLDVTQVRSDNDSTKLSVAVSQGGARTPLVIQENTLAGLSDSKSESSMRDVGSRERNENMPVRSKLEGTPKEKKKKATKVNVPSRYMQAATKVHVASSSSNTTGDASTIPSRSRLGSASSSRALAKKPVGKPSYSKRTVSTSNVHQSLLKQPQQCSRSTKQSQYSCTPMPRGMRGGGGVTSTPAMGASIFHPQGSLDASAIASSMVQGFDVSMAMAPASDTSVFPSAMSASGGQDSAYASLPIAHKKRHSTDITQDYLDRVYARYIQALFIDSKLEKALKEQERKAMSQMYGLWHENEKLRNRKHELEVELGQARHVNHLDQQLDIQLSGLGPVFAHLDQLQWQHSTMAHALDTTRHQLSTTGIHVMQDEDETLISALEESENLLGEISAVTRTQQPDISSINDNIQILQKAVDNEEMELRRCQELVSAASTLAAQESSLRIQQIEMES